MLGAWVGGLAMTTHIAADHAKFAGEQRNPVIPETQIAPEAVLNPDRLGLLPRIGEVVEFVVHLVIIGDDLRHFFSPSIYMRASRTRFPSALLRASAGSAYPRLTATV